VENRDPVKTYNKTDVAALPALIAKEDWRTYLTAAGAGADVTTVIVAQPSFLAGLAAVFGDTPIETFKAYLAYNLLSSYSG
jgi:predicted metalloendopeptidase